MPDKSYSLEQKKIELEAELRLVIDNIPLLVAYIDSTVRYRIVNKAYMDFFGEEEACIIGQHVKDVVGMEMFDSLKPHIENALNGELSSYLLSREDQHGHERFLSGKLLPFSVSNDDQNGFMVVVDDVTEQTRLMHKVVELNKSLEKKVTSRTKELQIQAQELRKSNRALKESEAKLRELSISDPLTGLLNRRGWQDSIAIQEKREKRNLAHGACIACIDLDGLKEINDTLGHENGDRIIINLADTLKASVRNVDYVARLGGDEFGILFVDSDLEEIRSRLNDIERILLENDIQISWGIAKHDPEHGFEAAMKIADRKMYEMKMKHRQKFDK